MHESLRSWAPRGYLGTVTDHMHSDGLPHLLKPGHPPPPQVRAMHWHHAMPRRTGPLRNGRHLIACEPHQHQQAVQARPAGERAVARKRRERRVAVARAAEPATRRTAPAAPAARLPPATSSFQASANRLAGSAAAEVAEGAAPAAAAAAFVAEAGGRRYGGVGGGGSRRGPTGQKMLHELLCGVEVEGFRDGVRVAVSSRPGVPAPAKLLHSRVACMHVGSHHLLTSTSSPMWVHSTQEIRDLRPE